jgi:pyocin large subunit-like protein
VGKRMAMPARMAGRQAQKIAAVVSMVDQMTMGTLEKVASMVMPKDWRLLRRMMDARHTLLKITGQLYVPNGIMKRGKRRLTSYLC